MGPGMTRIMISGYADSRWIAQAATELDVVTKPFTLDQLKRAIGTASSGTRELLTTLQTKGGPARPSL